MTPPEPPTPPPSDEPPGMFGLRSWRALYLCVFLWFALVVALLAIFTRAFA
jgi:hypothetical protein